MWQFIYFKYEFKNLKNLNFSYLHFSFIMIQAQYFPVFKI